MTVLLEGGVLLAAAIVAFGLVMAYLDLRR